MSHIVLQVDRDGRIAEDVPCAACDTPLKGEKASGLCPGCGEPIAHSLLGRAVCQLGPRGEIDDACVCATCKQPLAGGDPEGVCANCHAPVGPSLEANLLRYSDRKWLKQVSDGLVFYVIGLGVALVIGIGNSILAAVVKDPAVKTMAGLGATAVMGIFISLAVWWVTVPDPDVPIDLQKRRGPNLARALVIPQYVLALPAVYFVNAATTQQAQMSAGLYQFPSVLLGIFVYIGVLLYFKELARRVVEEKLERWAQIIIWVYVAGSVLAMISGIILLLAALSSGIAPGATSSPAAAPKGLALVGMGVGGLGVCVGGLTGLAAMIWMIVLIFMLRSYFAAAAKMAAIRESK